MDTIMADDTQLPADIDAQPVVQAAAALQPKLREYRDEIEREQRLPTALVEQMRAAGFYRMVIPRSLGRPAGRSADLYCASSSCWPRAAARSAGTSPTTASASSSRSACRTTGVQEIYGQRATTVIAGTAVQGGGQAVPVDGGYRVTGRWSFGSGCQESQLDARQLPDPRRRPAAPSPEGGRSTGAACSRAPRPRSCPAAGTWPGCAAPAASTGRSTTSSCRSGARWCMPACRSTTSGSAGRASPTPCRRQCWVGPHHSAVITGIARAGINALIELAGGKTPRGRTGPAVRQPAGAGRGRPRRRDPQCRARLSQRDDRRAVEHASPPARRRRSSSAPAAGSPRSMPPTARARRWI